MKRAYILDVYDCWSFDQLKEIGAYDELDIDQYIIERSVLWNKLSRAAITDLLKKYKHVTIRKDYIPPFKCGFQIKCRHLRPRDTMRVSIRIGHDVTYGFGDDPIEVLSVKLRELEEHDLPELCDLVSYMFVDNSGKRPCKRRHLD